MELELSKGFSIDPESAWVREHNRETRETMRAYASDEPIRVPVIGGEWYGMHGFYADEAGIDYADYYTNPETMYRTQLEAARRRRELPIYDIELAVAPDSWTVFADLWPAVGAGWVGCPVLYRRDAVIANHGLGLSIAECDALHMPDPVEGGILKEYWRLYEGLVKVRRENPEFMGRPVAPIEHAVGTNGFFSLALDIRGAAILEDLYEEPEFAARFLRKIANWCDALDRAWAEIAGRELGAFPISDHGIDMLSPALYERFIVPIVLEQNSQRGTKPSGFHHCGRGIHLFPVVRDRFGIGSVAPLTYPLIEPAEARQIFGDGVWITAMVEDGIVNGESPEQVRQAVSSLMASGVKGKGRFALTVGDMLKGTKIEHLMVLYQAVKEFGGYA